MANIAIRSFTSGEITPSLYARTDLSKYVTSLKTCRNFIIQRHGGLANRPGTGFVCEVKDSAKKVKLVPFVFNAEQTYMLEFGDLYMRVIRNKRLLTETSINIIGITQADPCVVTVTPATPPSLTFDVRSSRTGSNIKISIKDSGGTWTEITPNITVANTWQTITWNISGVANADKDVIDTIKITIVNADADFTFYIDNMKYGDLNIDLMEYATNQEAQDNYVSNGASGVDDSYTKLLLHMNGVNGSTNFIDEAGKSITANDASISTAQFVSLMGAESSCYLGDNGYLSTPYHSDFNLTGGVYTIDFRLRPINVSTPATQNLFVINGSPIGSDHMAVQIVDNGKILWYALDNGSVLWELKTSAIVLSNNTDAHVELVENGNDYYIFVDGVQKAYLSSGARPKNWTGNINIGGWQGGYNYRKYFQEFRLSKGIARHTGGFTPPTWQYGVNLKDFSESSIKTQGSYSLKGIARQTGGLNKTLTKAVSPTMNLSAGYTLLAGDEIEISEIKGMTELNNRNFIIANVASNTFSLKYKNNLDVNSIDFGTYVSDGVIARVYKIATPYSEADLPDLQAYNQSADIIILVHLLYPPKELKRLGHTSWTISDMTFGASISAPTGISVASGGSGSKTFKYVVTAVDPETGEESLPSSVGQITSAADPTASAPHTVSWTNISGVIEYDIYREQDGLYDWIGIAGETPFKDVGYTAEPTYNPPEDRQPFTGAGNYPSTSAFHQQRLLFANTNNNPEGVWTSKTALRKNFMISRPLQDDDAVTFSLIGGQVNAIRHMLNLGKLIIFTSSGEWVIEGDAAGILIPGEINPRQHTYNGSGLLPPIVVGGNALYVQARNSTVRDLGYDFQTDSYRGNELSIFSSHLFDGYSLVNWSYQQIPHSIVWVVRNDGVLLSMTYLREHQIFGWSRCDFDGEAEDVKVIPEGLEDTPYVVVKREINGRTVRYIEYMHSRLITDIEDAVFIDSSLSYDGRNQDENHLMTLTGGTNWTLDENLTLTSSLPFFESDDVEKQIILSLSEGSGEEDIAVRCTIISYTNSSVVTINSHKTVPESMRSIPLSSWSKAIKEIGGLWHLEGENLSVLADGMVISNPNNPSYMLKTVSSQGKITIENHASVIHAGLPIISDVETLNIDTMGDISSIADKKKNVNRLSMFIESSRGIWAGLDADNLTELKIRGEENEDYDEPIALKTGVVDINIKPEWKSSGSIFIRQIDPLPLSILAIIPTGYMG